jgi:3-hydroxyacyl-CoA dehydrogenase
MKERMTFKEARKALFELIGTEEDLDKFAHYAEMYEAVIEDLKKQNQTKDSDKVVV